MLLNPFCLRKALHDYINKYTKLARVMVHLNGNLANLHHENDRLLRENHQLKRMIKEKDERITQMHTSLKNNLDLARTIEFNSLPRKMKREILKGKTRMEKVSRYSTR